ncbi:MAG: DUF1292 domain-containing protein [Clostridia bacterium]|nr:DUF1292 domain-containing protein [Clostridia bacterium]
MAENIKDNAELQEDEEIIVLADEEGKEVEFRHIATLDYEEEWYMYLEPLEKMEDEENKPADGEEEETEMVIFHIQSDADGNDVFVPVEDEDLLDKLYNEFLKELDNQEE